MPSAFGRSVSRIIDDACGLRGRSRVARLAGIGRARFDDLASGNRTWYLMELEAACDALGLDIIDVITQARREAFAPVTDAASIVRLTREDFGAAAEGRDGHDEGEYEGA